MNLNTMPNNVMPLSHPTSRYHVKDANSNFGLVCWHPAGQGNLTVVSGTWMDSLGWQQSPNLVANGSGTTVNQHGPFIQGGITTTSAGYVQASASPTGIYSFGTGAYTVTGWCEITSRTDYYIIAFFGDPLTNYHGAWLTVNKTSGITGATAGALSMGFTGADAYSNLIVPLNTPTFCACVMPSGANISGAIFYMNAVKGTTNLDAADGAHNTGTSALAFNRVQATTYGGGTTWDLRIYNRALDAGEIMKLYAESSMQGIGTGWTQQAEMPVLLPSVNSVVFRKTLSGIGGRIGSRQSVGWGA